jgi:feruloyl esterase
MAPGMWHCKEGPGPSSFGGVIAQPAPSYDAQYDLLTSLTQWVEQGVAPTSVIATKYNGDTPQLGIAMQRPICSYPMIPAYKGTGGPNLASSFRCVASDASAPNPTPAPQYGP